MVLVALKAREEQDRNGVKVEDEADGAIVISATQEFVKAIPASLRSVRERAVERKEASDAKKRDKAEAADVAEKKAAADAAEREAAAEEASDRMSVSSGGEEKDDSASEDSAGEGKAEESLVTDEPLVSQGVASALALLKNKGVLRGKQDAGAAAAASSSKRQSTERGEGARSSRTSNRDRGRDRDRGNDPLDAQLEKFRDYKPDVRLEYYDEHGRSLNQKEAYRQLCYSFHGNAPGKKKTDKLLERMKRKELEERMDSGDTPLHLSSVLQNAQKALGSSHLVLSVGNRV